MTINILLLSQFLGDPQNSCIPCGVPFKPNQKGAPPKEETHPNCSGRTTKPNSFRLGRLLAASTHRRNRRIGGRVLCHRQDHLVMVKPPGTVLEAAWCPNSKTRLPNGKMEPEKPQLVSKPGIKAWSESKPGIEMVCPEPCRELNSRNSARMAGIVPYCPSITRVLIVTQMELQGQPPPPIPVVRGWDILTMFEQ